MRVQGMCVNVVVYTGMFVFPQSPGGYLTEALALEVISPSGLCLSGCYCEGVGYTAVLRCAGTPRLGAPGLPTGGRPIGRPGQLLLGYWVHRTFRREIGCLPFINKASGVAVVRPLRGLAR